MIRKALIVFLITHYMVKICVSFCRWAVSTVMTRQNQVPCKEDINKTTNTLIPFWDLGKLILIASIL